MSIEVYPVMGEVGRYRVQSSSHKDQTHLCDILEDSCGCADWTCKHRTHTEKTGLPYHCKHLKAARSFFLDDILESIKETQLSK